MRSACTETDDVEPAYAFWLLHPTTGMPATSVGNGGSHAGYGDATPFKIDLRRSGKFDTTADSRNDAAAVVVGSDNATRGGRGLSPQVAYET